MSSFKDLQTILENPSQRLAEITRHVHYLQQFEADLRALLPVDLAASPYWHLANVQAGFITLQVNHPSWATRMRLYQQRVLQSAQEIDPTLIKITIRNLPATALTVELPALPTPKRTLSASSAEALCQFADTLSDDDRLKATLYRLASYAKPPEGSAT